MKDLGKKAFKRLLMSKPVTSALVKLLIATSLHLEKLQREKAMQEKERWNPTHH